MSLPRLQTQDDGRALAVKVLSMMRDAGPERCRVNPRPGCCQADILIMAFLELKERATCEACIGFAAVMTDHIGVRGFEPVPELYDDLQREGKIQPPTIRHLERRLRRGGLRIAMLALQREREEGAEPRGFQPARPLTNRPDTPNSATRTGGGQIGDPSNG